MYKTESLAAYDRVPVWQQQNAVIGKCEQALLDKLHQATPWTMPKTEKYTRLDKLLKEIGVRV